MYTINIKQYTFQSNENIQPLIDSFIIQTTFLNYKIKYRYFSFGLISPYYDLETISVRLRKDYFNESIIIHFFINPDTKILEAIHCKKLKITKKLKPEPIFEKTITKNFSTSFQIISEIL